MCGEGKGGFSYIYRFQKIPYRAEVRSYIDKLVSPSPLRIKVASRTRRCSKLGRSRRTALNRSSSIDGLLLWMKGREGVSSISHRCVNSGDLKSERPVFRQSVSTILHLVEAFTYHLTKTQLGNIHSCSAQWLVLHLFHSF